MEQKETTGGEQGQQSLQRGAKVIRKSDIKHAAPLFGIIESIRDAKAVVRWEYRSSNRTQRSTLILTSLAEVTPEMEQDIRTKAKARREAKEAERDRERIYLCTNVNPKAQNSQQGHPSPWALLPGQTVNMEGKLCLYCGAPVMLREQGERA